MAPGIRVFSAVGMWTGVLVKSFSYYFILSNDLKRAIKSIYQNINSLQALIDSLAMLILQQGRALDNLTAEKGGYCAMIGEEHCYLISQSGIVKDLFNNSKKLTADI